jgi:hypothetical protein
MLRVQGCGPGRAFLHTARFTDRPSHADQLHADLWWKGVNVAQDAGTYAYNAPPPWDNALATTHVHNTLTLNGRDQMTRAGRFLWLDWAQAEVLAYEMDGAGQIMWVAAEHDGFRKLGALHQRIVESTDSGWNVTDHILPANSVESEVHRVQLAWLLPDWPWEKVGEWELILRGKPFSFTLTLSGIDSLSLFRSGQRLAGSLNPEPTWGWTSSTYNSKQPALLMIATAQVEIPGEISSDWQFFDSPK